jgi:hypothetical protein
VDARLNPFAPLCNAPPAHLYGRDDHQYLIGQFLRQLADCQAPPATTLIGLRGSGKTALLWHAAREAEALGLARLVLRCGSDTPFLGILELALRSALLLSTAEWSFHRRLTTVTDSLPILLAVAKPPQGLLICIDDAQRMMGPELDDLLLVVRAAQSQRLAIGILAAALPGHSQPIHREGWGSTEAQRLELPLLLPAAAAELLVSTALSRGLKFETSALAALVASGAGHPLTLQQLGASAWLLTEATPVRMASAQRAIQHAQLQLDAGFYRWRASRLAPQEQQYLRAMAELGAGPQRSGDIATKMNRKVTALAPTRSALIAKELLYSPRYGETAFTTPGYAGYLLRT